MRNILELVMQYANAAARRYQYTPRGLPRLFEVADDGKLLGEVKVKNIPALVLAQYAKSAALFGMLVLKEIQKTNPEWLGNEFSISDEVVGLIEIKCMEELCRFFRKKTDAEQFMKVIASMEGLLSELEWTGRRVTLELIDPFAINDGSRFKVVDKILVLA